MELEARSQNLGVKRQRAYGTEFKHFEILISKFEIISFYF
jgi:hypothetical protein